MSKLTSINFNVFVMHFFFPLQGSTFKGLSGTVGSSAIHVAMFNFCKITIYYIEYCDITLCYKLFDSVNRTRTKEQRSYCSIKSTISTFSNGYLIRSVFFSPDRDHPIHMKWLHNTSPPINFLTNFL